MFTPLGGTDAIKLSVVIIQSLLAVKTKRGFGCSRAEAIKFLMMCQAKRLNPFDGDCFLIGYDTQDGPKFSQVTAHQVFLKRAELAAGFRGMDSGIIVKEARSDFKADGEPEEKADGNRMDPGIILRTAEHQWRLQRGDFFIPEQTVVGGWATVEVEGRKIPWHRRLRLQRFDSGRAEWGKDQAGMICKCAEADALRSAFPAHFAGMYLPSEKDASVTVETIDLTSTASRLVETTGNGNKTALEDRKETQSADEKAEAAAGLAPEPAGTPTPRETPPTNNAQDQLAAIVSNAGFTFEQWRAWALAEGHIKDKELPSFDLVPDTVAIRLIRAHVGMVRELARTNPEAVGTAGGAK